MNAETHVDSAAGAGRLAPRLHAATAADLESVAAFLAASGLPMADLAASSPYLWIARTRAEVSGTVGLEVHGDAGLLRSLAVAPASRGEGLGTRLVDRAEQEARGLGLAELVLLTETASEFFSTLGYHVVTRDVAPAAIRGSAEFRALCPASAICMRKALT
jgi:N-acetylglutamate synthase-like GNAT family acetyltransferase